MVIRPVKFWRRRPQGTREEDSLAMSSSQHHLNWFLGHERHVEGLGGRVVGLRVDAGLTPRTSRAIFHAPALTPAERASATVAADYCTADMVHKYLGSNCPADLL